MALSDGKLTLLLQTYEGAGSSLELCKYHPGGPVFHEGLKYWSCCQRKTTDFTEFLSQAGCSMDSHVWTDEEVGVLHACMEDS